ncbi:MAG: zf-HC2 domain-containing protein [Pseudonocardiaceae bacterium]
MDCTECREALSACLDGEANVAESRAVDAHLAICAACRWFGDEAARVTRLARAAVTTQVPDLTAKPVFTIDGLATIRQVLAELDRDSTTCATAMMTYKTAEMVSATRAALNCADIAASAHRVLSRPIASDTRVIRSILEAAVNAADRCAMECGRHAGHHGHCRVHAETAQRAARLCRSELQNITG